VSSNCYSKPQKENENGTSKALKHVSDSAFNKFNESIGVTTNGQ